MSDPNPVRRHGKEEDALASPDELGVAVERARPSAGQVVKGVAKMGVVWAGGWAVLGFGMSLALSLSIGFPIRALLPVLLNWGVSGFLTGAGFATLLTTLERKNTLRELKLTRMAAWGGIGGFAVSFLIFLLGGMLPLIGLPWAVFEAGKAAVLGAVSAVGTTVIARSGE